MTATHKGPNTKLYQSLLIIWERLGGWRNTTRRPPLHDAVPPPRPERTDDVVSPRVVIEATFEADLDPGELQPPGEVARRTTYRRSQHVIQHQARRLRSERLARERPHHGDQPIMLSQGFELLGARRQPAHSLCDTPEARHGRVHPHLTRSVGKLRRLPTEGHDFGRGMVLENPECDAGVVSVCVAGCDPYADGDGADLDPDIAKHQGSLYPGGGGLLLDYDRDATVDEGGAVDQVTRTPLTNLRLGAGSPGRSPGH